MALRDQVALITGSCSNAKLSNAVEIAQHGAHIALQYNPTAATQASYAHRTLSANYPNLRVTMHSGNFTSNADVERMFADVLAKQGRIDMVVTEAGKVLKKPATQLSDSEKQQMLAYTTFVEAQAQEYAKRLREEAERRRRNG